MGANKFDTVPTAHRGREQKRSRNPPLRGPSSNGSRRIIHRDVPLRTAEPALFSHCNENKPNGVLVTRNTSRSANSFICQIDLLELFLRFVLEPDVVRESIRMPYLGLFTVRPFDLFERRSRLDLKNPIIL